MIIKMTGASGYLGNIITAELKRKGHKISPIQRELLYGPAEILAGELKNTDVLINLAGAPVLQRWTTKNKKEIYDSRVLTVENLVKAFQILFPEERPAKVISASAIGIYEEGKTHTEESFNFDRGFLGEVVKDWEKSWKGLPKEVGLTIFRIAVVLGKESATIQKLLPPFKLGIGGKIGNGKQPFPFIHETDVARAFTWAAENKKAKGVFNMAAPQEITNAGFTRALAKKLNRPAFIPVPPFALKLVFGKASSMLTKSPAVLPHKITEAGFEFKYPTIEETLEEIFGEQTENSK
ncbi:TIGR01777 family oxidoreductase [Mariniphaga sp.]|uniref:TIGR01777 family oxidoreductase n=1 Tax=Mariniphaga sp. TaxID=1954475 RepID=UPI00356ACE7F